MKMRSEGSHERAAEAGVKRDKTKGIPKPTTAFRHRAWVQFQRAIDPLASPKPFRIGRR